MKKIVAIFILIFMISGLLISCNNSSTEQDNQNNAPTADFGTGNENETPDADEGVPDEGNTDNIPDAGGNVDSDSETLPDTNETEPGTDETEPDTDETEPGTNETEPDTDETEPGKDENKPESDENLPESGETQPDTDESLPEGGNTDLPELGTAIGNRFIDLEIERIDGGTLNTADYRGKIIIFNMWGTWCPYCLYELPDFEQIAEEYADEVVVIAVHSYSQRDTAPAYVDEHFPDSKIIFAYDNQRNQAFISAGGSKYYPRTAIIDKDGVIVYAQDGMMYHSQLVEIIEELS